MKLSFSTLACPTWSWDDILANAKRFGYDGVELRFIRDLRDLTKTPEFQESNFARTKRQLADAGLEISCVDTSCSLTKADSAALALAQRHIELAAAFDCPCVRIFGGDLPDDLKAMRRAIETDADKLRILAEYAKPLGVRPLVETHDGFVGSSRIVDLMQATAHDNTGALWDVHHPFRVVGEPVRLTYICLREYVHHVHIKDSVPLPDKKYRYTLLGEGDIPVRESISLLKQGNYKGWLSLEWEKTWHPDIADPEIALPQYSAELRKML